MSIQYRPTVAEIDLDALRHNVSEVQKRVPKGTHLLAIVKANAYGHGALICSRILKDCGVPYLGVATIEEGIELRNGGIRGDLFVLDGLMSDALDIFIEFQLKPVIHQVGDFERLGKHLKERGKELGVHVKLDTGMGRLGIFPSETDQLADRIKAYPQVKVEGIFTHLARADEADQEPSERQFLLFDKLKKIYTERGLHVPCYHIANSAAIIDGRLGESSWVRPGIVLYGAYPSEGHRDKIALKPVMTLKSKIISLKRHPQGSAISYGGTFVTKRESLIGIVPVGYADGYHRLISNRGSVLVKGKRVPVVGRICMDLFEIDVTDIPGVSTGDTVVLFGKQEDGRITIEEVASWAETISYEILCGITSRVPRIYLGV